MYKTMATKCQYEDLGNAIILDAMQRYAELYRMDKRNKKEEAEYDELIDFFYSDFCDVLCPRIDADVLMELALKKF